MRVPSKSKKAPTRGPSRARLDVGDQLSSVQVPDRRRSAVLLVGTHGSTPAFSRRARRRARRSGAPVGDDVPELRGELLRAAGRAPRGRRRRGRGWRPASARCRTAPATATPARAAGPAGASAGPTPRTRRGTPSRPRGVRGSRAASRSATTSWASTNERSTRWATSNGARQQDVAAVGGLPVRVHAARARRRAARGRRRGRGRRTRTSAGRAGPHRGVPAVGSGRASSTSSAIARSTKWWIALLR